MPQIPNHHQYRLLIIRGSEWGKANGLLKSIGYQLDIDKILLSPKDPFEGNYRLLINKRESVGLKHCNDPKAFI